MIQFISNHPIWAGVILYLIIGFLQGVQYYLTFTYKDLQSTKFIYTVSARNEVLNEYFLVALIHILLWFPIIVGDIYDLYIALNHRFIKEEDRDTSKDWPENYSWPDNY